MSINLDKLKIHHINISPYNTLHLLYHTCRCPIHLDQEYRHSLHVPRTMLPPIALSCEAQQRHVRHCSNEDRWANHIPIEILGGRFIGTCTRIATRSAARTNQPPATRFQSGDCLNFTVEGFLRFDLMPLHCL